MGAPRAQGCSQCWQGAGKAAPEDTQELVGLSRGQLGSHIHKIVTAECCLLHLMLIYETYFMGNFTYMFSLDPHNLPAGRGWGSKCKVASALALTQDPQEASKGPLGCSLGRGASESVESRGVCCLGGGAASSLPSALDRKQTAR